MIFAGFRKDVGFDYENYQFYYYKIIEGYDKISEPVFRLLIILCEETKIGYLGMFFVMAFLAITIKAKFFLKFSIFPILSFLLYYCRIFLMLDFGQIRQGLALGIILFTYPYILKKDIKRFTVLVLLASLFHYGSILFFPIYFFAHKILKKKTILLLLLISTTIAFIDLKPFIVMLLSSFFVETVAQKVVFYGATEDVIGLTFSIYLRISILLLCIFLIWNFIKSDERIAVVFNIYLIGVLFYLIFNSFPQIGGRGSLYFQQFEVLLFPFIILGIKKYRILQLLLLLFFIFYCYWGVNGTIESQDVFIPYQNIIF
jgi:hypothetical protein